MGLLFALFLLAFILFVAVSDLRAVSAIKSTTKSAARFSPGGWTPGQKPATRRGPEPGTPAALPEEPSDVEQIKPS